MSEERRPVVLVCDPLDPEGLERLRAAGVRVVELGSSRLGEAIRDADAALVRSATRITAEVLEGARRLRAVGRAGIGVDNIDVGAATRLGVVVMNTPLANATTTAELALAHLFALARRIPAADRSMHAGLWEKERFVGTEITGKTLGIAGLGKIGRILAQKALGLGMHVLAYDPFLTGKSPVPEVQLVEWEELLRQADFVSVHVPRSKDTLGLVDREALARMKPTAFLIHCARGGIVVEEHLMEALRAGALAGAALDVFEQEPLPADHPLRALDRVILTPHLGASSEEAQRRVSLEIADQIVDFLQTGEARFAVNAPAVSSDTLRALRPFITLGRRAASFLAQTMDEPPRRIEITYSADLARQSTEVIRGAVLEGLLAPSLEGPVNAVNAPLLARERGWKVLETQEEEPEELTSGLKVVAVTADGRQHCVVGAVFRGQPRLIRFDDFGVDLIPEGSLLMTHHRDAPGVLGLVATWFGARGINISGLHMGVADQERETALALFQISRPLTAAEEADLAHLPPIVAARSISL